MPNDRAVNQQMTTEQLREAFEAFVRSGPGFRSSMLYRRDMAGSERFGQYVDAGIEWQWRALQAGYALSAMASEHQISAPFSDPSAVVATKSAGVPGVTLYDLGPSRNPDSAISRKLIELGWTPPAARCDCGKKLASDCEPWEPDCDLGKSAEHARPGRFDGSKIAQAMKAQQSAPSEQPAHIRLAATAVLSQLNMPHPREEVDLEAVRMVARAALAQQPAAGVALTDQERGELERLRALVNTPELHDFSRAVVLEAAHQRERWGSEHDAGKAPQDWFWLLGYLGGKALAAHASGNADKALHHTISSAAALANWHAAISGTHTAMRPGIDPVARGITAPAAGQGGEHG